jgi:23S rRNA (adenine2503-C2)-methyltransferase
MQKNHLFGKSLDELKEVVQQLSLPDYAARQLADWLYKKEVTDFDQMSNLPKEARRLLSENYVTGLYDPVKVQTSVDGTK